MRHNISANYLFRASFRKTVNRFLGNASPLLNGIIGGWQIASALSHGLPTTVAGNLAYNANYWLSSLAILTKPIETGSPSTRANEHIQ